MATVQMPVRVPENLAERYKRLAEGTGRTRSFYITRALENSINDLEYKYGILRDVEKWRAGTLETIGLDDLEESLELGNQD